MMTGIFIVNMGTLLDLKQFIEQWKVVVLGLAIVIVGGILMFFVSRPILGNNFAVALVGPITGGWVSAVVVNDAIKALGGSMYGERITEYRVQSLARNSVKGSEATVYTEEDLKKLPVVSDEEDEDVNIFNEDSEDDI
jgi:Kef-type K+ transport system membrane component KefB